MHAAVDYVTLELQCYQQDKNALKHFVCIIRIGSGCLNFPTCKHVLLRRRESFNIHQ